MNRKDRKDRTVYIMLTDYPDKVSRAIKRVGLWEYSHMSISTDEHYPKFFSFTGKRGFMTEDFDLHPTYKGTDVPCALFALPVTETELRNVERIIKHMTSNAEKYKYSYIGLALLYLRIIPKQRGRDTCVGFGIAHDKGADLALRGTQKEILQSERHKVVFHKPARI